MGNISSRGNISRDESIVGGGRERNLSGLNQSAGDTLGCYETAIDWIIERKDRRKLESFYLEVERLKELGGNISEGVDSGKVIDLRKNIDGSWSV